MHRRIPALLAILALLLLILAPVVSGVAADVPAETEAVTTSPTEEIKARPKYVHKPLLLEDEIPLDVNTQIYIYGLCDCDRKLFCAVMAIAATESDFDTDVVGDEGISVGMCQINTVSQADRIEALGVTDLTDPIQCATVAIDYITWLVDSLDTDEPYSSHALYMAYNMGLLGSLDAQANGITETRYTREATWYYETYLEIVNSRM